MFLFESRSSSDNRAPLHFRRNDHLVFCRNIFSPDTVRRCPRIHVKIDGRGHSKEPLYGEGREDDPSHVVPDLAVHAVEPLLQAHPGVSGDGHDDTGDEAPGPVLGVEHQLACLLYTSDAADE